MTKLMRVVSYKAKLPSPAKFFSDLFLLARACELMSSSERPHTAGAEDRRNQEFGSIAEARANLLQTAPSNSTRDNSQLHGNDNTTASTYLLLLTIKSPA